MEIWKDINGYEGSYQVSSTGKVKSLPKSWVSGKGVVKNNSEKELSLANSNGYKLVQLSFPIRKLHRVHRLVAEAFISNPANLPEVNHIDGDKSNNAVWNLEWCSKSENQKHSVRIGLKKMISGEKHHFSKLSDNDILKLKVLYETGNFKLKELASKFNTSIATIHNIIKSKTRNINVSKMR